MPGRIIEISSDGRYLSKKRGFMIVSSSGEELARVALDEIDAVIANAHGLTYSNNLLVAMAKRNVSFVLCGPNHSPVGFLWPLEGNYSQAARFEAQTRLTRPKAKRLWQQIVRAKLSNQADVLKMLGKADMPLRALMTKVRVGDPENIEAQGARRYWSLLFGKAFRRDRGADDENALLNYGYTILRSATARSILASGLHPTLGLHHSNSLNPMRLVDDLMEPFRPLIDLQVWQLVKNGSIEVNKETKESLVKLLYLDLQTEEGCTPVVTTIERCATTLAQICLGERDRLSIPAISDLQYSEITGAV